MKRAQNSLKRASTFADKVTTRTNDSAMGPIKKIAAARIGRAQLLAAQRRLAQKKLSTKAADLHLYTRTKQRLSNRVTARKNAAMKKKK